MRDLFVSRKAAARRWQWAMRACTGAAKSQPRAAPGLRARRPRICARRAREAAPRRDPESWLPRRAPSSFVQEEEARLQRLRQEQEAQARAQQSLVRGCGSSARCRRQLRPGCGVLTRGSIREHSLVQLGQLCATPYGVDIVGVTEFVALVGALVGGITARHRKQELERLNEQLRKINLGLRQQARAGTVYAPGEHYLCSRVLPAGPSGWPSRPFATRAPSCSAGLTYAPAPSSSTVGGDGGASTSNGNGNGSAPSPLRPRHASAATLSSRPSSSSSAVTAAAGAATATAVLASPRAAPAAVGVSVVSVEEEDMSPEQLQCRETMRLGKRLLRDGQGAAAMVRFEKALMLCKGTGDKVSGSGGKKTFAARWAGAGRNGAVCGVVLALP